MEACTKERTMECTMVVAAWDDTEVVGNDDTLKSMASVGSTEVEPLTAPEPASSSRGRA